jgi:hypothetical protein
MKVTKRGKERSTIYLNVAVETALTLNAFLKVNNHHMAALYISLCLINCDRKINNESTSSVLDVNNNKTINICVLEYRITVLVLSTGYSLTTVLILL